MIERIEALLKRDRGSEWNPADPYEFERHARQLLPLMLAFIEGAQAGDDDRVIPAEQALEDYCAEHLPEKEEA